MGSKGKRTSDIAFDPYHIWLAGLGAAARSQEEGSQLFAELTEHGREVVAASGKKARRRMQEVGQQLQAWVQSTGQDVGAWFGRTFDAATRSAGLPSVEGLQKLRQKVDELARRMEQVEEMRRAQRPASSPAGGDRVEVRVLHADGAWQVRLGGEEAPVSVHPVKTAAVAAARALADARQPSVLVVQSRAGEVTRRARVG